MLVSKKNIFILFLISLIFLIGDVFFEVNFIKLNKIEIATKKINLGEQINIIQISDLHNKTFFNNNAELYEKIKDSQPDFIVITGDFIDKNTKDYTYAYNVIDELLKINQNIYFVAGDHEQKNTRNILIGLADRGVKILDKSQIIYKKNKQSINIYGLDYYNDSGDIDFIKHISQQDFSILLLHNPDLAINNENIKADLILSGDTHGGQIRLPFLGAITVPGQGFFPKYSKGLYFMPNESLLYIDSGLGNTLLPIRFLNQSQVSLIQIKGIGE